MGRVTGCWPRGALVGQAAGWGGGYSGLRVDGMVHIVGRVLWVRVMIGVDFGQRGVFAAAVGSRPLVGIGIGGWLATTHAPFACNGVLACSLTHPPLPSCLLEDGHQSYMTRVTEVCMPSAAAPFILAAPVPPHARWARAQCRAKQIEGMHACRARHRQHRKPGYKLAGVCVP